MSKKFVKEIKYDINLTVDEGDRIALLSCENQGHITHSLVLKSEWNKSLKKNKDPFVAAVNTQGNRFSLMPKEWWTSVTTMGYAVEKNFHKEEIDPTSVDWKNMENEMVYNETSSHLLYDIENDLIPIAHYQGYIGGITDDKYDLKKAQAILDHMKNKGIVLNYEMVNIPYYNQDCGSKSLEFTWILPKDKYNFYWKKILAKKSSYPTTKVKNIIFEKDFGLQGAKRK